MMKLGKVSQETKGDKIFGPSEDEGPPLFPL
jgi:hypothetical protein